MRRGGGGDRLSLKGTVEHIINNHIVFRFGKVMVEKFTRRRKLQTHNCYKLQCKNAYFCAEP